MILTRENDPIEEAKALVQERLKLAEPLLKGVDVETAEKIRSLLQDPIREAENHRDCQQRAEKEAESLGRVAALLAGPRNAEAEQLLTKLLEQLKPKHRIVIELRYKHNKTTNEIAKVMGHTSGYIYSLLKGASYQLSRRLARAQKMR